MYLKRAAGRWRARVFWIAQSVGRGWAAGLPAEVASDTPAKGFVFPESVGCDSRRQCLYVAISAARGAQPAERRKGYISKARSTGMSRGPFSRPGRDVQQSQGIWIQATPLGARHRPVWVFDLKTARAASCRPRHLFQRSRVLGGALTMGTLRPALQVEPATSRCEVESNVSLSFACKSVNPNGLFPARAARSGGGLLAPDQPPPLVAPQARHPPRVGPIAGSTACR